MAHRCVGIVRMEVWFGRLTEQLSNGQWMPSMQGDLLAHRKQTNLHPFLCRPLIQSGSSRLKRKLGNELYGFSQVNENLTMSDTEWFEWTAAC
jgi:hypothetical protein